MNVGITGSNGFIGSHLSAFLKTKNINVKSLAREKKGKLLVNNLSKFTDWKDSIKNLDVIVHCGARVHKLDDKDPLASKLFNEINVEGTKNLAEQAANFGVKKFIFLSTIKVNGENTNNINPFNRKSSINPQDSYAKSKAIGERILNEIHKETKMSIVIIRIPIVYGPKVKANFKKLLWIVNKGIPLPFGNVRNKRSYLYIKNLEALIYECCINNKANNKLFLASDMEDLSTTELIIKLKNLFNSRTFLFSLNQSFLMFLFKLINKKDMLQRLTDSLSISSSECFEDLNFVPPYTMDEGLKETVDWFLFSKS